VSEVERRLFRVYGFESTHDALTAEAVLRDAGVATTVMPTPRELGELCGIALRVAVEEAGDAEAAMRARAVVWRATMELLDR